MSVVKLEGMNVVYYKQLPLNRTLIEDYKRSGTLDKHSFLIGIKFKAMLPVRISDDF